MAWNERAKHDDLDLFQEQVSTRGMRSMKHLAA